MHRPAWLLILLLPASAFPAGAQAIRLRAREEGTERAAPGALATLRDSTGRGFSQTLTNGSGYATLLAPYPGTFLLRIDRIGFPGVTLGPFRLRARDTLIVSATVPSVRRTLPEMTVQVGATADCRLAPELGESAALLWEEARKALAVSELADTIEARLSVTRYRRDFGPGGGVIGDSVERMIVRSNRPFDAADPATLAKHGFRESSRGGFTFYAPDARVLLSDAFLGQHCFSPAPRGSDSSLAGLSFSPNERYRKRVDVEGTLWLDRTTATLRSIEFRYTNVDRQIASGHEGGEIGFVRVPDGGLIVARWRVRVGFYERGGEVALLDGPGKEATVVGMVFDSLAGMGLAGAIVRSRAGAVDTTNREGRFQLPVPAPGPVALEVEHPLLSFLDAVRAFETTVQVKGEQINATFATPGFSALAARVCPRRPLDPAVEALLFGLVSDTTGQPPPPSIAIEWNRTGPIRPGYRLTLTETSARLTVEVGRDGRFWACGIPGGQVLRIDLGSRTDTVTVAAGHGAFSRFVR